MKYDPEQLDLLMKKVASTLGSRLEGLLKQQQNVFFRAMKFHRCELMLMMY